jgi:hypothetical protein
MKKYISKKLSTDHSDKFIHFPQTINQNRIRTDAVTVEDDRDFYSRDPDIPTENYTHVPIQSDELLAKIKYDEYISRPAPFDRLRFDDLPKQISDATQYIRGFPCSKRNREIVSAHDPDLFRGGWRNAADNQTRVNKYKAILPGEKLLTEINKNFDSAANIQSLIKTHPNRFMTAHKCSPEKLGNYLLARRQKN